MSYFRPLYLVALVSVGFIIMKPSLGSMSGIVPARGEKISFSHTYSTDHLKNHPLQMVKKTGFTIKNSKGLLTGTWTATIRDIRTDETFNATSTGLCRSHSSRKMECAFDATAGTVFLLIDRDGLRVTIPVGQGVQFSREKEGLVWSEILLGADEDNREFKLVRNKTN